MRSQHNNRAIKRLAIPSSLMALISLAFVGAFSVASTAGAPQDDPQESYSLRYKFTPGETVRWNVVQNAKIRTTINAVTQSHQTEARSVKVWEVKDVLENGNVVFVTSVESVFMRQRNSGEVDKVFDSTEKTYESDAQGPVRPEFAAAAANVGVLLNQITLSPIGELVEREVLHDTQSASESPLTIPLPEKSVKVGESWSFPQTIGVRLKSGLQKNIKCRQTFTLESVTEGVAAIKLETIVLEPINDRAIEVQLVQQSTSGVVSFHIADGRIVEQKLNTDERVVGAFGPNSSFQFLMTFEEKLLKDGEAVASKPGGDDDAKDRELKLRR